MAQWILYNQSSILANITEIQLLQKLQNREMRIILQCITQTAIDEILSKSDRVCVKNCIEINSLIFVPNTNRRYHKLVCRNTSLLSIG